MKPERKAELAVILALVILPASFVGILRLKAFWEQEDGDGMRRFTSYQQLRQFLTTHQKDAYWPYISLDAIGINSLRGGVSLALESSADAPADVQHSTTNIQVEGVDEADVVKTDGEFIYVVSGEQVLLISAYPPESMALQSTLNLEGSPMGMFISGNRLVVFEQIHTIVPLRGEGEDGVMPEIASWVGNVSVKVYDIYDRSDPRLLMNYLVNGYYSDSRMLEHYVYLVVVEPAIIYNENVLLPRIYGCDGVKEIAASDIYYYESSEGYHSFNTVFAINVQDENAEPSYETFLTASSDVLFMSRDNIYIAQTIWAKDVIWNGLIVPPSQELTAVHKIHVDGLNMEYVAKGEVPGHVLNQFSMDEFDGFFRIATTSVKESSDDSGRFAEVNNLYVLDPDMKVIGTLEDLAPGERIHSARFMGDRCYLVTFKKVDPLFVIDLSSPVDPKVLGRLKIPGYSDYLHPFGEGFLIGVGKETVEAEEGDFAWYQGLKVSLFDVRELENPTEISKLIIGDRGTDSPVLRDHKAFLLDMGRGLLIMPVLVAKIDRSDYANGVPANAYGEYVWQGAYVLSVSTEDGIEVIGRITHLDDGEILKSGYYFESKYSVERALYIDDVLYTLSEGLVKANDISTLKELNALDL